MDTTTAMVTGMNTDSSLMHLLQLASPTLPVGAYAYSQGLEHAIEQRWVESSETAASWLSGVMRHSLVHLDLPVFIRVYKAIERQDQEQVEFWNRYLLASRESMELQNEDLHLGNALMQLLADVGIDAARPCIDQSFTYTAAYALASVSWGVVLEQAMSAFLWSWIENQVAAAIKLVPLGQTDGQRILMRCQAMIPAAVTAAFEVSDEEVGFSLTALAIGSAHHEQQYSRLFRS